jgi:predicted ATPase
MIEEPEISLHIESQLELPKLFSEAIKEGKQVIVTTHSEHLILALKPLIASGELKPEDVAIWHFEKTEEGTKAARLKLTGKGIVEGWIPSYVKAEKEIIKEWVSTLPEA